MNMDIMSFVKLHIDYISSLTEENLAKELDAYPSLFDHMLAYLLKLGLCEEKAKSYIDNFRAD